MISLLVAMDQNHVIGFENDLPWHLPADLQFFKQKTTGHTIVMGRKTYESIGKALPNRKNVVLTRQSLEAIDNVTVIHDIALIKEWHDANPDEEIFVIGGGHVFEQILPIAHRMYITEIESSFKGDTYFPKFCKETWQVTSKVKGDKNEDNPYDYCFIQYDRL
ncbi:dihydrofolate reductase [Lentibacillus saliphilus]|uniref:dihydrofolate reductase n=1 Tax=Lentibacillus saliphilus TaxID=2737028 RepID=UPI001C30CC7E|nr:dihydrofolate reductase [Lentibacillus saliphilus]